MHILENVPLSTYSTMHLGGTARYLTDVTGREELAQAVEWAKGKQVAVITIGRGSNIIWQDQGFTGLVIVNKIGGFTTTTHDNKKWRVTIGAGENWDSVVQRCIKMGLSGIEQLSLIPGTTGATPIQNVGAYGREIADCLVSLEAYDSQVQQFVTLQNNECAFGYRTSRFKTTDKGRFFITSITLELSKTNPTPPFYASLQAYLDEHHITDFTPQAVRQAVIAIRTSKLPDPEIVPNNGSFFSNPVISPEQFSQLQAKFPDVVSWPSQDKVKVSAAWLVEQAGFKGIHDSETGMATWDKHALVLVNEKAQHTADLLKFKQKILDAVQTKFGVTLEQEPELIGS